MCQGSTPVIFLSVPQILEPFYKKKRESSSLWPLDKDFESDRTETGNLVIFHD